MKDRNVDVQIRIRPAAGKNFGGRRPKLDHIDLISGGILGAVKARDVITNPTTRVVAQVPVKETERDGEWLVVCHRFENVKDSFYVRLRGTNRDLQKPEMGGPKVYPWDDLWFYSNPVMIRV